MSRSLRRRIEVLESGAAFARNRRPEIAKKALNWLWQPVLEQLLSALCAQREGRALTPEESDAKEAYEEALVRECRWAGYSPAAGFEDVLKIRDVIMRALAQCTSPSDLEPAIRASEAEQQGLEAAPEDLAALYRFNAERIRLYTLAGIFGPAGTVLVAELKEDCHQ